MWVQSSKKIIYNASNEIGTYTSEWIENKTLNFSRFLDSVSNYAMTSKVKIVAIKVIYTTQLFC